MIKPQTLKGFRDFLPQEARKRQYVINTLRRVFEFYNFDPLETPALEYEEILTGKYGEEGEKLMYRFEDNGKRKVAMRYDQTVPLSRVVAQYQNEISFPFMRYQIQPVWRAENTQKGRFREFLQCDADIVGSNAPIADAKVIMTAAAGLYELGFTKFKVLINDRELFAGIPVAGIIAIDKLKKIGEENVCRELVERNICNTIEDAQNLLKRLINEKPTKRLSEILETLNMLKEGVFNEVSFEFSPTLARGLDYYTSTIFEIEIEGYDVGSVCGGGRFDELIGVFAGRQIPAVGFALGFDRIIEAMDVLEKFPDHVTKSSTKVLVTIFSEEYQNRSLEIANKLTLNNINEEIYPGDKGSKMDKQLKYANQKQIPYVIVVGPNEAEKNILTLKNMETREQQQLTLEDAIKKLAD